MKRVKLMLTGIALVTVIGGIFAFKAQNFSSQVIYTTRSPATGFCTIPTTSCTITSVDPGTAKTFVATTGNVPCVFTWTKAVAND